MSNLKTNIVLLGAALALGLGAASAQAATKLDIDINTINAQAFDSIGGNSFGVNHTGTIQITHGSGVIAGMELDDIAQLVSGTLTSITGTINLSGGDVTGGSFNIQLTNGIDVDSYSFSLSPDINSQVVALPDSSFLISSPTAGGSFDDVNFGGVDVSSFPGSALTGIFVQFNFAPDQLGLDRNVDLDLQVNAPAGVPIPLPAAAWAGLALMGAIGGAKLIRRRAQKA